MDIFTGLHKAGDGIFIEIKDSNFEILLEQVACHVCSHVAQADKADMSLLWHKTMC